MKGRKRDNCNSIINKYIKKIKNKQTKKCLIIADCSNTGFMSFKLSMVVQSNFSGEQRPEASYFKLRKTPSTLSLHREVLEGPVVLPGEPPSAGVLPAHTPH